MVSLSLILGGLLLSAPQHPQIEFIHADHPPYQGLPDLPGEAIGKLHGVFAARDGQYAVIGTLDSDGRVFVVRNGRVNLVEDGAAPWAATRTLQAVSFGVAFDADGSFLVTARESGGRNVLAEQDSEGHWTLRGATGWTMGAHPAVQYVETRQLYHSANAPACALIDLIGVLPSQNQVLHNGTSVIAHLGIDGPTGIPGNPTAVWTDFYYGGGMTSPDLNHTLVCGAVDGLTGSAGSRVLAFDGQAVAKESVPLYGSSFTEAIHRFRTYGFTDEGSWYLSGWNRGSEHSWMLVDGQLALQSGDPILPGDSRVWSTGSEGLIWYAADAGRQWVGGRAVDPNGVERYVVVELGRAVLLQEGDPVDWNGDGLLNDHREFARAPQRPTIDRAGRLMMRLDLRYALTGDAIAAVARLSVDEPTLKSGALVAGQPAVLDLSGGEPGATAYLGWSQQLMGGQLIPTPFGPIYMDLAEASFRADAVLVDAAGQAQWTPTVLPRASGWSYVAQVLVIGANGVKLTRPQVATVQ